MGLLWCHDTVRQLSICLPRVIALSCTVLTSICFDLQLFPIQAYLPGAVEAARGTRLLEPHTPVPFSSPCIRRDGGHERHFEAERHLSSNQQLGTNCFCFYWHRVHPRDAEHFRHVTASSFYQLFVRLFTFAGKCLQCSAHQKPR